MRKPFRGAWIVNNGYDRAMAIEEVASGRADLVALGRPHLVDPSFTMKAAAWYGTDGMFCPPQYLPGKEQIFRNSVRDRQDLDRKSVV